VRSVRRRSVQEGQPQGLRVAAGTAGDGAGHQAQITGRFGFAGRWCCFAAAGNWPWLADGATKPGNSQPSPSTSRTKPCPASTSRVRNGSRAKSSPRAAGSMRPRGLWMRRRRWPSKSARRGKYGSRGQRLGVFLANWDGTTRSKLSWSRPPTPSRRYLRS
jgi:hypothetical protein